MGLDAVAPLGLQLIVAELFRLFRVELEVREVEVDGVIDSARPELQPDRTVKVRGHIAAALLVLELKRDNRVEPEVSAAPDEGGDVSLVAPEAQPDLMRPDEDLIRALLVQNREAVINPSLKMLTCPRKLKTNGFSGVS